MFKQIVTLFRGAAHDAAEEITDRNALKILNQQMRDSVAAVDQARKAVAVTMAQNRQETDQYERLVKRIADLEARAITAMEQEKEDLAREAAETITFLEAERDASAEAQQQFSREIARLRENVHQAEMKLRELQRGQRLATATDKAQKLRSVAPQSRLSSLREAEETLIRLRTRQKQIDLTDEAMAEMDASGTPSTIVEKLAAAGCGAPLKSSADDVLQRLKAKAAKPAKKAS
jgi:phage shock protein A